MPDAERPATAEPVEDAADPAGGSPSTAGSAATSDEDERPDLLAGVGGPLGVAESALPPTVFATVYALAGQDAQIAAIAAVGLGVVLVLARLVRGQTLMYAVGGLLAIGVAGAAVALTGRGESFFLPNILKNAAYGGVLLISILVRWPLIGLVVGSLQGEGTAWRRDPVRRRRFALASWVWVAVFAIRLLVQVPLYAAGAVATLGAANVFLGIPLFAVALWLSWLLLRVDLGRRRPAAAA